MALPAILSNARPASATWRALGLLAILLIVLFVFSGRVSMVQVMDNARSV